MNWLYFMIKTFISMLLYRWVNKYMGIGHSNKNLQVEDIYSCLDTDKSESLGLTLQR